MKCEIVDSPEKWDQALALFPDAPLSFSYKYHQAHLFVASSYSLAFLVSEGDFIFFFPLIINPIIGTPFFDSESVFGGTGPLALNARPESIASTWSEIARVCRQRKIVNSFVRFNPFLNNQIYGPSGAVFANKQIVAVPLLANLEQTYSERQVRFVRQAEKAGLSVRNDESQPALEKFYKLYIETMQRVKAKSFFFFDLKYFENLREAGNFILLSVLAGTETVASACFLISPTLMHYHFAGSNTRARESRANNFLIHQAALLARSLEKKYLDLGGGVSSSPDDALFIFKSGFSRETRTYYHGELIHMRQEHDELIERWRKKNPHSAESRFFQLYRFE